MSTFGGWMPEFPDIRGKLATSLSFNPMLTFVVDYFRYIEGVRPPLACFLSHVHTDHLAGLESLKAPFVYCSAATKELLLRLERYPHRINFELGVLESRKQHYKHLKNLLKPIPLETPTRIELAPGNDIQVTLFDANHCTGAVMVLIEGSGHAVLYTGDIRSEPWFVNALTRNPILVEYVSNLKTLDCIYLDTSFTDDVFFQTKAEGLEELLRKVSKYPPETVFHFAAWTFGYEEVWIALSRALKSRIHVDSYKMRLYQSLRGDSNGADKLTGPFLAHEAPALTGYRVGNTDQPGILTLDNTVKLHSCDKGIRCSHLDGNAVWIRPIVARTSSGAEIAEMGVGGGGGDLTQRPELEIDSDAIIEQLLASFAGTEPSVLIEVKRMLLAGLHSTRKALALDDMGLDREEDELSLEDLVKTFARSITDKRAPREAITLQGDNGRLPRVITFPYSRHSSYAELRALVKVFKPVDIYPCTVDKTNWHEGVSMRYLFGDLCSGNIFRHDREMREEHNDPDNDETQKSRTTCSTRFTQESGSSSGWEEIEGNENDLVDGPAATTSQAITPSEATGHRVHRDSRGRLRLFDQHDNLINNLPEAKSGVTTTPTAETLGSSVEGETENRRRKADSQVCGVHDEKRVCLQLDGSGCGSSDDEVSTSDPESTPEEAEAVPGVSYYDSEDDVYRCEDCGWELWTPLGGCVGCSDGYKCLVTGLTGIKDSEKLAEESLALGLCSGLDRDIESDTDTLSERRYLDGSSAYDSVSGCGEEGYEANSFIDDTIIHGKTDEDEDGSDRQSDDDVDYEARYHQLSSAYDMLAADHAELIDDHDEMRRDFLGSDYESDNDDVLHFEAVDIEVRDPPLSELILPQVQGDSQSSVVSTHRLRTRVEAFLAADDGDGWHNVSLMSTGDNHTEPEVEL
jgi:DNA cross-link repair 1C protein